MYRDASLPIDDRVADLLQRMTLEEKIAQLNQSLGWKAYSRGEGGIEVSDDARKLLSGDGMGSLYGVLRADPWTEVTLDSGLSPREGAEAVNAIQRFVVENTRLGIPLILNEELSHGHMAIGATTFPVPIGMASTWNPDLMERVMRAAAVETRAQGCTSTCSPILDLARDPRWGRTEEMFGEDTFLCSEMGVASVRGLQGESLDSPDSVVATIKHFVHGCPEGGRNAGPAHMGPRELREVYLPPFKAAVEAGAESLMSSYNEIDGVPCSSSRELLTDILRDEWGFQGFVISDLGSVHQVCDTHRVVENLEQTAAATLRAGVDVEMGANVYRNHMLSAVRNGLISEEDINLAVSRVLRVKFMLGLFENPYTDPDRAERVIGCEAHRELAREAARQSVILLKNENNILSISREIRSIAVIGPSAANIYNLLGDYTAPQAPGKVITVLDGIGAKLSPDATVRYARGCGIRNESREGFAEAVQAAKESDIAVVVLGGSSARGFGPDSYDPVSGAAIASGGSVSEMECGEGLDRTSLDLAGVQMDLLREIHATGTPVVVVLINGRPYSINWIAEHIPAILEAWYPGQEGGNGIADVLFGDYNPAGRLPVSVPRSAGQLPVFYSTRRSGRYRYVEMDLDSIYPFGYGLSYTSFAYDNLEVSPGVIGPNGTAVVSVDVTNTGKVAGDEVVQLYIGDDYASVTRPVKELKGFDRVHIAPGETGTVTFEVTPEHLQVLDAGMKWTVEPGIFTIMVGPNSNDLLTSVLEVTP